VFESKELTMVLVCIFADENERCIFSLDFVRFDFDSLLAFVL
jgi:hypothetical protein